MTTRHLYPLLIFLVFAFACKKNSQECVDDRYSYECSEEKKIDTLISAHTGHMLYRINNGNDLVFTYTHSGSYCKKLWTLWPWNIWCLACLPIQVHLSIQVLILLTPLAFISIEVGILEPLLSHQAQFRV